MSDTTTASIDRAALKPYRTINAAAARRRGMVPGLTSVDELHAMLPADGTPIAIWERIGHVRGVLTYGLSNVRATARGIEVVCDPIEHKKAGGNGLVMIYPLGEGRDVRTLIKG